VHETASAGVHHLGAAGPRNAISWAVSCAFSLCDGSLGGQVFERQ
jgi:hypothetical protein